MPDWKGIIRDRLAPLGLDALAERELTEEIAQHLEERYRELQSGGSSAEDAFRETVAELEDVEALRADAQLARHSAREGVPAGERSRGLLLDELWRDLRYALRMMRRSPAFVVFVVLTLAVGIGGNTTVFTVVNTLLLDPLPVRDPSGLAAVAVTRTDPASAASGPMLMSFADLQDYRARNQAFTSLAAYTPLRGVTWQAGETSRGFFTELVTGDYFATLGLEPARGRFFLPEEDGVPGAHPVAVINHGTWQTRFGGAADIVGRTLRLNDIVVTIVGVAPPRFIGVNAIVGPDLWIPAAMAEALFPNTMQGALTDRTKGAFRVVGRLETGVTREQAQANMATVAAALAREYPASHDGYTATVAPIRDALFASTRSGSAPVVFASAGLLAVVAIILLIACSNVANLLLARSAVRQQEMAVRVAMGASRRRLMRQLLTESLLLASISGVLGLVLAYAGLQLLFSALPGSANFVKPHIDVTVLVFSLAVSLLTGLLFGILPAFRTSGASVADALKEEARMAGRSRRRVTLSNALLVGQVAFSFLLLVTSALFLRSIQRAYGIDPGFQTEHLAVFVTNPGQAAYGEPQARAFYREVRERVAGIPQVASVSWATNMPLWASTVSGLEIEGRPQRSAADTVTTIVNTIDAGYFETMGIEIVGGRDFSAADREGSAPVAIVNEKLAHDYWPGGDAIGRRIRVPGETVMRQVVGIAATANYTAWGEQPQPCVFVPLEQHYVDAMILYVRSAGSPGEILLPVQQALHAVAPRVLVSGTRTGREIIDGGLFQARMAVALLGVFGLLALGLASLGLYGIMAYSVAQRRREIGVRMALGAAQRSVLGLILRQGMSLVLAGVSIGLVAALLTGRLLAGALYGIGGTDPVSIAGATAGLLTVALLACYLPARRASRVDPLVALRQG